MQNLIKEIVQDAAIIVLHALYFVIRTLSPRFPGTWKNHQPLHHDFDQAEGLKPKKYEHNLLFAMW